MRHVSPCVELSLRFRTVVALPGVVVHGMERHTTRLYGPCPGSTRYPPGRLIHQPRPILPALDCSASDLGRCPSTVPLGYLDRCAPGQRDPPVAFRQEYLELLPVFVSQASALQHCTLPSPAPGSSGPSGKPSPRGRGG